LIATGRLAWFITMQTNAFNYKNGICDKGKMENKKKQKRKKEALS
jgi:hypothetical protein